MTEGVGKRIAARLTAVSPAGSVGASASQRCPPDTRTAMTAFSIRSRADIIIGSYFKINIVKKITKFPE